VNLRLLERRLDNLQQRVERLQGLVSRVKLYGDVDLGGRRIVNSRQPVRRDDVVTNREAVSGYAPVGSAFVTVGADATLTAERNLAAGLGVGISDGGANSAVTVDADDAVAMAYFLG